MLFMYMSQDNHRLHSETVHECIELELQNLMSWV